MGHEAVLINLSVIRMNWLASMHILKMAGQSFGREKNYRLTVTVYSEPLWRDCGDKTTLLHIILISGRIISIQSDL